MSGQLPRFYDDLAAWWPLLSAPEDYEEEATFYTNALIAACERPPRTLLELGSGGGNNAWHMKSHFELTLVDIAPGMLDVSRALNPECEHIEGDMRTVRLGREFDCVFAHDAIVYMTTERDLRAAVETAFVHCAPGGIALFAPDHLRETFRPSHDCGGHDRPDRALRYLEWTWDPDPSDHTYTVDYALMMRDADGRISIEHDRHIEGLFSRDEWLRVLEDVGFVADVLQFDHSELEPASYFVFTGTKPDAAPRS